MVIKVEDVFTVIKNAVIRLLKGIDSSVDVFTEKIKKTEEEEIELEEYYFLTILPIGNETVSKDYTDRRVYIDISYYHNSESNAVYLKKMSELDTIFRPVFRFQDRAVTTKNIEMKLVEDVLHYSFSISFRDCRIKENEVEVMKELSIRRSV